MPKTLVYQKKPRAQVRVWAKQIGLGFESEGHKTLCSPKKNLVMRSNILYVSIKECLWYDKKSPHTYEASGIEKKDMKNKDYEKP